MHRVGFHGRSNIIQMRVLMHMPAYIFTQPLSTKGNSSTRVHPHLITRSLSDRFV